jgi:hypothetical protein
MDVTSFLKTVPAVIGVAGLLTYFMRPHEPVIDDFPDVLRSARNTLVVLTCLALIAISVWLIRRPAPPDHDATLKEGHSGLALLCSFEDGRECLIGRRRT